MLMIMSIQRISIINLEIRRHNVIDYSMRIQNYRVKVAENNKSDSEKFKNA